MESRATTFEPGSRTGHPGEVSGCAIVCARRISDDATPRDNMDVLKLDTQLNQLIIARDPAFVTDRAGDTG
jgi:hypothetical protein